MRIACRKNWRDLSSALDGISLSPSLFRFLSLEIDGSFFLIRFGSSTSIPAHFKHGVYRDVTLAEHVRSVVHRRETYRFARETIVYFYRNVKYIYAPGILSFYYKIVTETGTLTEYE